MAAGTLNRRQVAARISRSPDWFSRHWRIMVERHGLPAPLPGPGHKRWSQAAIDAWTDQGAADQADAAMSRSDRLARRAIEIVEAPQ